LAFFVRKHKRLVREFFIVQLALRLQHFQRLARQVHHFLLARFCASPGKP